MKQFIYADNAATTKLDLDAFEAMKPFLLSEYGNASQPYSFSRSAKKALKESREIIAYCIGAEPEEIFFTSGGTESNNWAIKGSMFAEDKNRETITSSIEHHSILNTCAEIEKMGYHVSYLPVDLSGKVHSRDLFKAISNKTRLVSIMMSNNEVGTIQDISSFAQIAHSYGALFHTDAVQSVGHLGIDVKSLDVDLLSASAHKFNGPKGIGFLYIRKGTKIVPLLNGGAQELSLRAGTENISSIVGMAIALKNNVVSIKENSSNLIILENLLIDTLKENQIKFIRNGNSDRVPGNISLSFPGYEGESLLHRLDLLGICVSTGSACDSKNTQISHVLKAMGIEKKIAKGTIRISLGKNNNCDDVMAIASALIKVLK